LKKYKILFLDVNVAVVLVTSGFYFVRRNLPLIQKVFVFILYSY